MNESDVGAASDTTYIFKMFVLRVGDKWMNFSKINDFDKCIAIIKMSFHVFISEYKEL